MVDYIEIGKGLFLIIAIIIIAFLSYEANNIVNYQHSLTPYKTELCIENGFDGFKADGHGWYVCHKEVCEYSGELKNCEIERKEFENLVELAEKRRDFIEGKN